MSLSPELLSNANLLIVEIGNSHVTIATYVGHAVRTWAKFGHSDLDKIAAYATESFEALGEDTIRAVVYASVVPDVLATVRDRLTTELDAPAFVVGEDLHRPISLAVENPERVGIDRVCSAAAAYEVIGRACAVASVGTAITIDCVNDEGVFMGGSILPGLALQAQSLHDGTAALPLVKIEATGAVYGANTEQAIRNGVLYGVVGALREIVERYATELHEWPQLVVTGGGADLVRSQCDFIDNIVPDLCLRGIGLAFRRHFAPLSDDA